MTPEPQTARLREGVRSGPARLVLIALSGLGTALILGQLLLAGLAVFDGLDWGTHKALGGLTLLPILAGLAASYHPGLSRHRRQAGLVMALYLLQATLPDLGRALGSGALQALHAVNAGLLLMAAARLTRQAAGQG